MTGEKDTKQTVGKSGDMSIWILHDSVANFQTFLETFKESYPQYNGKTISVESFDDITTYTNTLSAAIISGNAPDIFVVPSGSDAIFVDQIAGISPEMVSPNDFRLRFDPVFWEDLITTLPDDTTVEFLQGIPMWYEALGILYNRKYFLQPSELTTWTNLWNQVNKISEKYTNIIPIALGNGSWVSRAPDILQAFFTADGANSLALLDNNQVKQILTTYHDFWDTRWDNRYNILSTPFVDETDIDFFTQGDVAAMIWYPRDVLRVSEVGYQKSLLFATPFPSFAGSEQKSFIHYTYFALNKDSDAIDMAESILQFMSTTPAQELFSETFPYYLSPETSIYLWQLEKKILPEYNIVYKNFLPENSEKVTFEVWDVPYFYSQTPYILDMENDYETVFLRMKEFIVCSVTKQTTLLNLSSPCR